MEVLQPENQNSVLTEPKQAWYKHKGLYVVAALVIIAAVLLYIYLKPKNPPTLTNKNAVIKEQMNASGSATNSSDDVLQDDSDLKPNKVNVADNDNGFFDLSALKESDFYDPAAKTNPNSTFSLTYTNFFDPKYPSWDEALAEQVLEKNQKALDAFSKTAEKNYFQIPNLADPANVNRQTPHTPLNTWRSAAKMQAIKAISLSWQGKTDEALKEAIKLNIVGKKIVGGNADIISSLVGIGIQRLGSQTILEILPYGKASSLVLKQALKEVGDNQDNQAAYQNIFKFEYNSFANTLDLVKSDPTVLYNDGQATNSEESLKIIQVFNENPNVFKPNQTKNLLQLKYRTQLQAVGKSCVNEESSYNLQERLYFNPEQNDPKTTENWYGKFIVGLDPNLFTTINIGCQNDLVANVAQTELAIRDFLLQSGNLPSKLDDLTPNYFSAVPLDPYTQKPLYYNKDKKIIYSLGKDKKDLGGSEGTDWTKMDNPTFKIKF